MELVCLDNKTNTKSYKDWTENKTLFISWSNVSKNVELLPVTVTKLTWIQPFAESVARGVLQDVRKQRRDGLTALKRLFSSRSLTLARTSMEAGTI